MVVPRVCRRAVCGAICGEVPVVVVDESRCCRGGIAQIPSDSYETKTPLYRSGRKKAP